MRLLSLATQLRGWCVADSLFQRGHIAFLTCYWPHQGRGQCGGVFWARRSYCDLAGSGFEAGRAPFLRHGLSSGAGEALPRAEKGITSTWET